MKRFIIAFPVFLVLLFSFTHLTHQEISTVIDDRSYSNLSKEEHNQIDCLALNIYREAGIEKTEGKIAVALVTMNRLKSEKFPDTVCKVVKQKTQKVCQFSWVCMSKLPKIDEKIYSYSKALATAVFLNYHLIEDFTDGALFYHADYVSPKWKRLEVTTKIGRHIFYKPIGEKQWQTY
jgi:spore germination cell wall hydrolase CwlJ-like protein